MDNSANFREKLSNKCSFTGFNKIIPHPLCWLYAKRVCVCVCEIAFMRVLYDLACVYVSMHVYIMDHKA